MYCRNCGSYNSDSAEFCTNCGQPLRPPVQNAENPESTGFMENAENPGTPENTGGMNNNFYGNNAAPVPPAPPVPPAYQSGAFNIRRCPGPDPYYLILRKYASSKLLLAAIILFGMSIALNIANYFILFPKINGIGVDFPGAETVINTEVIISEGIFFGTSILIMCVYALLPTIFMFTGMLLIRIDALKSAKTNGFMRKRGFSLINGIHIYMLVKTSILACMLSLAFIFSIILSCISFKETGTKDIFQSDEFAIIITMIFLLIPTVLGIIFQAKVIKTMNGFKQFAAGGAPYKKPSLYVIVFGFIGAGILLIFSGVMMFVWSLQYSAPVLIWAFTAALASIFILTVLTKYRKEMLHIPAAQNAQPSVQ